jgi:hypothetical protein
MGGIVGVTVGVSVGVTVGVAVGVAVGVSVGVGNCDWNISWSGAALPPAAMAVTALARATIAMIVTVVPHRQICAFLKMCIVSLLGRMV